MAHCIIKDNRHQHKLLSLFKEDGQEEIAATYAHFLRYQKICDIDFAVFEWLTQPCCGLSIPIFLGFDTY